MCSFLSRSDRNIVAAYLLILAFVGPACLGATPATQPHSLVWDFSKYNRVANLHTPKPPSDGVFYIEGKKDIHLKVRGGLEGNVSIISAQVVPQDGHVVGLVLFFDPTDLDETYTLANKVADAWKIDKRDQLDLFKSTKAWIITQQNFVNQGQDDHGQTRSVEIRSSMQSGPKRWIVMLRIELPNVLVKQPAAPATQTHALVWDFSSSHGFSSLHIPTPPTDDVFFLRGRKDVHLKLRGGLAGNVSIDAAQVFPENGKVAGLVLFFEPTNLNDTYTLANKVADQWQIDKRDKLEQFKTTKGWIITQQNVVYQGQDDRDQSRLLEIRSKQKRGQSRKGDRSN